MLLINPRLVNKILIEEQLMDSRYSSIIKKFLYHKIWMSCADRQNLYWVVLGASIPTGVWSGFDESSVRMTHTLRRIEERPCFTLEGVFNPSWPSKDTRSGILPLNLGQSPKSTLRSGGSSRGTTSQQASAPAGVGPTPFLNCLCPLNGVRGH